MLVSVVLPTHIRRPILLDAVNSYLSQEWKEKELVVIDEGNCRDVFDCIPENELVYIEDKPLTHNLAMKRNIANKAARGEVIIHFDSDDWSASTRINHQVEYLLTSGAEVTGYHTAHFWDEPKQEASCYLGAKNYSWGAALCYLKDFAVYHPWPEDVNAEEDNHFVGVAQRKKLISAIDGRGQMVARILGSKNTNTTAWPLVPTEELPLAFRKIIGKA